MAPSAFLVLLLKNPKDAKEGAAKEDKDEALDFNSPIMAAPAIVVD